MYNRKMVYPYQDNRFAGGFAAPFILGGITGGLLAPAFILDHTHILYIMDQDHHMDHILTTKTPKRVFFYLNI